MSSLITIAAPGDVMGAISSVAGALTAACQAVQALAADQSPEGRQAVRNINAVLAPLVFLFTTLDKVLGIKAGIATQSGAPTAAQPTLSEFAGPLGPPPAARQA